MVNIAPYLLYGSVAVFLGILVYYGLPLALLQLNFGLILTIFFILLLGMLVGLVIILINLQPALEQLILFLLLFWENKSMRSVNKKNMISHRQKNKLMAIIYALSLGSIICLLTAANLQIGLIVGS